MPSSLANAHEHATKSSTSPGLTRCVSPTSTTSPRSRMSVSSSASMSPTEMHEFYELLRRCEQMTVDARKERLAKDSKEPAMDSQTIKREADELGNSQLLEDVTCLAAQLSELRRTNQH